MLETESDNPFRYCGEYYDAETGLIYLRNRYYDTATGRFITEDPVKDGLNWYAYCANNPVMYTDPWGLEEDLDEYIAANYANQMTVTIAVNRPVANSREVATIKDGKLINGHTFLRIDDGMGKVRYIGFAAVSKNLMSMVLGMDIDGKFNDDKNEDWQVAKVYPVSKEQYNLINDYIDNIVSQNPDYNIESYNCTTFAVNAISVANIASGNFMTISQHNWTLPNNISEQMEGYAARGWIPVWAATLAAKTMARFWGYTPADAAQDLKNAEGEVLLKYDGSIKTINNTFYYNEG